MSTLQFIPTTNATTETLTTPSSNDVILGRGNGVARWPGNVLFRSIIRQYRQIYQGSKKYLKLSIAQQVMDIIVHEKGGRFLAVHDDKTNVALTYQCVTKTRALEKISQALREKVGGCDPSDAEPCRTEVKKQAKGDDTPKKAVADAIKASKLDVVSSKTKIASSAASPIKNCFSLRSKKMVLPMRKERRHSSSGDRSPSRVIHPTFRQLTAAASTKDNKKEEEKSDEDQVAKSVRVSGNLDKNDERPVVRSMKPPTVRSGTAFKTSGKSKKAVARHSKLAVRPQKKEKIAPKMILPKMLDSPRVTQSFRKSDRVVPIAPFPRPPVVALESSDQPICATDVEPATNNTTPSRHVVSPMSHEDATTTRDRHVSTPTGVLAAVTESFATNAKIDRDTMDLGTCAVAAMNTTITEKLDSASSSSSMLDGSSTTMLYSPSSSGNRPLAIKAGFLNGPQCPLCSSSTPRVGTNSSDNVIQEADTGDPITVTAALDVYALLPAHLQQFFCHIFPEINGRINGTSCSSEQPAADPAKATIMVRSSPPHYCNMNSDNQALSEEIADRSMVIDPADPILPTPIDPRFIFHGEEAGNANRGRAHAGSDSGDIWAATNSNRQRSEFK